MKTARIYALDLTYTCLFIGRKKYALLSDGPSCLTSNMQENSAAYIRQNDKAKSVLLENNCLVSDDTVVGVVMPDTPGGLTDVLTYLSEEKINIEYLYAFLIPQKGKACVVLRVSAPHEVDKLLLARGFELIDDHLE